jgi:NAD(P)-dependent dehydrogenase (short-subunit alcohol dehydrogenase family)
MQSVVISGVSTGIGEGAARELCRRGYRVYGTVRKSEDGERLRAELGEAFAPLLLDVRDEAATKAAAARVAAELDGAPLFGLVNNAGIADPGPLLCVSPESLRTHYEINVIGVLHMVQAFVPIMRARDNDRPGRIINISSVAGRLAYPFMGAYAASKHALEALSDSLRRELLIYGIDVIVIQPGTISTPIFDKAAHIQTAFADSDYQMTLAHIDMAEQRRTGLPVSVVSDRILTALTAAKPRTRYVIPNEWIRLWLVPRYLPDRWLDRIADRMLGFARLRAALKR